jgi:hypothetical protein
LSFFRRLALGFLLVTLVIAAGYVATVPRSIAARAGTLAPAMALGSPEIIGTIDPAQLSAGPIIAIAVHGDHAYLLQNHTWLRVSRDGVHGPFGGETRGARGWIASAAGIAVLDSAVYVLDRLSKSLHVFAPTGAWQRTIRLTDSAAFNGFLPERIAIGPDGMMAVSGYRSGAEAGWSVILVHEDTARLIFHRSSNVFDVLLPLVTPDRTIAALSSNDYEFSELTYTGRQVRRFARPDPPRSALESTERAAIHKYLASVPASNRPEYQPPVYLPAVAHAHARSTGTYLVAVAAGGENVFVEEIRKDGSPLRTFMERGVPLPVGFFDDGIVLLREEAQRTVVERYSLPGTDP